MTSTSRGVNPGDRGDHDGADGYDPHMSTAESHPAGFEVVVAPDGTIPAEVLERYGFRPGSHLRLVPEPQKQPRKSVIGILKGKIDVEAIEEGLRQAKAERLAAVEADDE